MTLFAEEYQLITGLDPVADALAGTVSSDVVDAAEFDEIIFVCHVGVGVTGTSTLTVEACDDIVPTTTTAVAFFSRSYTAANTEGAITARTTSGYLTVAGSTRREICMVKGQTLASTGYRYVRLTAVEGTDSPVLGGILILGRRKVQRALPAISAVD